jgi:hypothetical protein
MKIRIIWEIYVFYAKTIEIVKLIYNLSLLYQLELIITEAIHITKLISRRLLIVLIRLLLRELFISTVINRVLIPILVLFNFLSNDHNKGNNH